MRVGRVQQRFPGFRWLTVVRHPASERELQLGGLKPGAERSRRPRKTRGQSLQGVDLGSQLLFRSVLAGVKDANQIQVLARLTRVPTLRIEVANLHKTGAVNFLRGDELGRH